MTHALENLICWHYICDYNISTFFYYRKNSKIWDTSNICYNWPKNRKVWCNIALMHPKDADGMANSVDPDQTASSEAVWSWSALFAETYLSQYIEFVRYLLFQIQKRAYLEPIQCIFLKVNGLNFRGNSTFLPPFSIGVDSLRKEFASLGSNSFLYKETPFWRATLSAKACRVSCKLKEHYFRKRGRGHLFKLGRLWGLI